jgi:hypothetical protein
MKETSAKRPLLRSYSGLTATLNAFPFTVRSCNIVALRRPPASVPLAEGSVIVAIAPIERTRCKTVIGELVGNSGSRQVTQRRTVPLLEYRAVMASAPHSSRWAAGLETAAVPLSVTVDMVTELDVMLRSESRPAATRASCRPHRGLERRHPPDGWSIRPQAPHERACQDWHRP